MVVVLVVDDVVVDEVVDVVEVVGVDVVVVCAVEADRCFCFGFAAFAGRVVVVLVVDDVVEALAAAVVPLEVGELDPQAARPSTSTVAAAPVRSFTIAESIR